MDKKIVIACQSCGYLMRDMIKAYSDAGYSITLITSQDSWDRVNKEMPESVRHQKVITYDRSSTVKRLWTWSFCTLQMWWKIIMHHKEEILYVSNPPFAPLLPLVLRNKFSVLIWDIYPDVLVNQNVISNNNFIAKWWRKANKIVYDKAEHVYTISDGMKDCLSQYVNKEKIKVIPLWPDMSNLHKIEKMDNLFIKNNKLEGKFIVMYSGNLGNTHRMDVLVDVAKRVEDKDVLFILIGEGGKKKMIERRMLEEDVKNVLLLPYQPYEFLSHSLSAADIAVITLDTVSSQMSVPSKTFNMMSLGKPLMCIASPKSELGNIVKKYQLGEIFHPEDIEGMTDFVLKLKREKSVKVQYAENSLKASKDFTVENAKMFIDETIL